MNPASLKLVPGCSRTSTPETSLAHVALPFVGHYVSRPPSLLFDFEELSLDRDGSYTAQVDATLVNPAVRSFGVTCTLPERGTWNAFLVGERIKLRIRPTTGRARVYEASRGAVCGAALAPGVVGVALTRRGGVSKLASKVAPPAPPSLLAESLAG